MFHTDEHNTQNDCSLTLHVLENYKAYLQERWSIKRQRNSYGQTVILVKREISIKYVCFKYNRGSTI